MEFNFTVRGDRITADKEYAFVEGNKGYYEAVFDFGEDEVWLGGAKICIIENKDKVYKIPVIGNRCILPEMLRGSSKIGVFCVVAENEESARASTNMIGVGVQDGASGAEVNAEMNTAAEVWEKYLSDMEQNRAAAEEARGKAEDAASSAKQSASDSKQSADKASGSSTAAGEAKNAAESAKGEAEEFARQADGAQGRANAAANAAAGFATRAEKAAIDASGFADTAIRSAESIRNMEVSAESVSPESDAKVQKKVNDDGTVNLHYLIPKGQKGDQGEKGDSFTYDDMTEVQKDELSDRVAEKIDIPEVENEAINNLKYYGDVNISPSDEELFEFELNDSDMVASIKVKDVNISGDVVVPYSVTRSNKTYSVIEILDHGFQVTFNIKSLVLPKGMKSIGLGAFVSSNIEKIIIPKSVASISRQAMAYSSLTDIYYEGTEEEWNKITFGNGAIPDYAKIHYNWIGTTQGYVDDKIGDIENVLDSIITIQNTLIGGGSV